MNLSSVILSFHLSVYHLGAAKRYRVNYKTKETELKQNNPKFQQQMY